MIRLILRDDFILNKGLKQKSKRNMSPDITGKKFNMLLVLEYCPIKSKQFRNKVYKCKCACGNITYMSFNNLTRTKNNKLMTKSCGCMRNIRKHNMSYTPEYRAWIKIKNRCYNSNNWRYTSYGGRGIIMHDSWKESFIEFYNYIGPRPSKNYSIDRIDVNGNYEPGNVRWATYKTQNKNKRKLNKSNTGITGVYKSKNKYIAAIGRKKLGTFDNIEDAITARREAEDTLDYYK